MRFRHLNVPDHWQHYWTKYPEGYTILEAIISWVSQVDQMTDNVNDLNETVESFRTELDEFKNLTEQNYKDFTIATQLTIDQYKTDMDNKITNYQDWVMANSSSIVPYLKTDGEVW